MSLVDQINNDIKTAMLAKDKDKLEALRAVKSALLLAGTEKGAAGSVSDEVGIAVLQKLVKQRKEAADIFRTQSRIDLAEVEEAQAKVIAAYLPEQMSEQEIEKVVSEIIAATGASSPADMGKVMGQAVGKMQGKADGKMISAIVKKLLAS
jgi:uncharacterized protein